MKNGWILLFLMACSASPVLTVEPQEYDFGFPSKKFEE
jgi:hypothetical protein